MVPWKVEPSQARSTRGAQLGGGRVAEHGLALAPLEAAGLPGLLCLSPSELGVGGSQDGQLQGQMAPPRPLTPKQRRPIGMGVCLFPDLPLLPSCGVADCRPWTFIYFQRAGRSGFP